MRETDKLANEKFNGNIEETIKYILKNYGGKELEKFVLEWTPYEGHIAVEHMKQMDDVKVDNNSKNEDVLNELNLTKEEVIQAKKNPYRAKLGRQFLKLLIVNGGLIALAATLQSLNIGISESIIEALSTGATSIFTTYMALDIGPDLVKYFKFRKLKKQYDKENDFTNNSELNNIGGKVL